MSNKTSNIFGFMLVVIFSLLATVYFAYHWVNFLFGDNSIQVYNSLKYKKEYLEDEISRLQKEYFELKNLEPEE